MAENGRLRDKIPEGIEMQSGTIDGRDEIPAMAENGRLPINAQIQLLEAKISGVVEMYANKTTAQNILLGSCVAGDGAILAAVWSGQKMKDLLGCASATSTLILSGLVSTAFICAFVYVFVGQFRLLKRAEYLQQLRDSIIDRSLPQTTLAAKRRFCSTYSNKAFENTSATWWLPRALFLAVLMAISGCLLLSCARLLC